MLIAVVVLFILCWGPIMTNNLLVSFNLIDNLNVGDLKRPRQAMYVMSYFNSCINPFLYAFMSKNFRNAFKQTFLLICRSKPVARTRNGSFIRYSFQSRSTSFISGKLDCRENATISRDTTTLSSLSVNRAYQSNPASWTSEQTHTLLNHLFYLSATVNSFVRWRWPVYNSLSQYCCLLFVLWTIQQRYTIILVLSEYCPVIHTMKDYKRNYWIYVCITWSVTL